MTTLIADVETNGLLDEMTKFHMFQIGDADGDDSIIYADLPASQVADVASRKLLRHPIQPLGDGLSRLMAADTVVFHNGLGFDLWAIQHFFPGSISRENMLDTLVMARLADPEQRDHSLASWGTRLGILKGDYRGDFQTVDDDLLVYSEQDVVVGRALYHKVKHVLDWGESCALEHDTAYTLRLQEMNGFKLDLAGAEDLAGTLRDELQGMMKGLQEAFPPVERRTSFIPKVNNKTLGYVKGVPFTKRKMEEFNPRSRQHCVERLQLAGWTPSVKTDDGSWKLDENILKSLPFPEAKTLQAYFGANKMLAQLSDGKEGWLRHVKPDGRVHGRVNPNGAVTGRMTHSKPNMANIDKDERMRGLWVPQDGWNLIGCDAEGLEARMLAHYLFKWDKGAYGKVVLEGSSKNRTDVHSANVKACIKAGLIPMECWKDPAPFKGTKTRFDLARDAMKTGLYAMMYGAQDPKIGQGIRDLLRDLKRPTGVPARELGALFRSAVGTSIIGLNDLTEAVKARALSAKYVRGLDGRRISIRAQHAALNSLLQGGGAIVMKKAQSIWRQQFEAEGWALRLDKRLRGQYGICANVHDEWQVEADPAISDHAAVLMADSIRLAGEHFDLKCPLAGKSTIGPNWAATH